MKKRDIEKLCDLVQLDRVVNGEIHTVGEAKVGYVMMYHEDYVVEINFTLNTITTNSLPTAGYIRCGEPAGWGPKTRKMSASSWKYIRVYKEINK